MGRYGGMVRRDTETFNVCEAYVTLNGAALSGGTTGVEGAMRRSERRGSGVI